MDDAPGRCVDHLAIIMDGNGRWATNRGLPRLVGHHRGAEVVRNIVIAIPRLGVKWLTLYAFSTENWNRSTKEILGIMAIFARYIEREADRLAMNGVRMRFIGDRDALEPKLQKLMDGIEARTAHCSLLNLTVAINYGGRDEITRAVKMLTQKLACGVLSADRINQESFAACLDTQDLPDPDLVIRTSGEFRISNFLSWQGAYAEYEFTPTLWPDFTTDELEAIISRFGNRIRRFGGVLAG